MSVQTISQEHAEKQISRPPTVQFYCPDELRDRAIAEANRQDRSLSNLMRLALKQYLAKHCGEEL